MSEGAAAQPGRRRGALSLLWVAALMLNGCLGYRLGTTLPPGIRTAFVPTVVNATGEPRLEAETTRAIIEELQRDGTLRIADEQTADAVLDVELTGFSLVPLRYEEDQARMTQEYRMVIRASVTFRRSSDGEVLVRQDVRGRATFEPSGDLALEKRETIPGAARDLAREVVRSVVEYW